ncbi:MAG: leucine-rich repeat domain-containing protein [Lentisphaeria bacterium]|nr:leucine-rich repeat domain-containing protein [Lentisphaeria bacterium]
MSTVKRTFAKTEITDNLLEQLISRESTFEITGLDAEGAMTEMVERVEKTIESQNKTCRVYTAGRSAAVAAAAIPTGITQVTGVAAAIGIGLHNFATFNPDYEIAKHLMDKKLSVDKQEVMMENGEKKSRWSLLGDIVIAGAGALADSVTNAAEKSVRQNGSKEEIKNFMQQKNQFAQQRQRTRQTFMHLTGNDKTAQAYCRGQSTEKTEMINSDTPAPALDLQRITMDRELGVEFSDDNRTLQKLTCKYKLPESGSYVIPSGIETIGECAFKKRENLAEIIIPQGVTTIEEFAFFGCKNLMRSVIPESVAVIGELAFADCEKLSDIVIPEGVETIGDGAFRECGMTDLVIPAGVMIIGERAFSNCKKLKRVVFSDSICLTTMGDYTFDGCENLTEVIMPDNIITISNFAFKRCPCEDRFKHKYPNTLEAILSRTASNIFE